MHGEPLQNSLDILHFRFVSHDNLHSSCSPLIEISPTQNTSNYEIPQHEQWHAHPADLLFEMGFTALRYSQSAWHDEAKHTHRTNQNKLLISLEYFFSYQLPHGFSVFFNTFLSLRPCPAALLQQWCWCACDCRDWVTKPQPNQNVTTKKISG